MQARYRWPMIGAGGELYAMTDAEHPNEYETVRVFRGHVFVVGYDCRIRRADDSERREALQAAGEQ